MTLRFKREWRDVNADGDCIDPGEASAYTDNDAGPNPTNTCPGDIVLYNNCMAANNCFGFGSASLFSGGPGDEGYPVIEIDSVATYGSGSFRQVSLDVARNKINLQVNGAITARSNVTVSGSGYVDGHNYNLAGTAPSSTCFDLPGVTVNTGLTAAADDDPATTPTAHAPGGQPQGPLRRHALLRRLRRDRERAARRLPRRDRPGVHRQGHAVGDDADLQGELRHDLRDRRRRRKRPRWPRCSPATRPADLRLPAWRHEFPDRQRFRDARSCTTRSSTPRQWETSAARLALRHLLHRPIPRSRPAANGPATLSMNGTVNFTGVIVADQIMRVNGTTTTIGAVLSIGGVSVDGGVSGNWVVKYSCEAIEKALAGFGYGTKIAWHRLR